MELDRIEKEKMELETLQQEKALWDHAVGDVVMDDGDDMDVDMPPMSQSLDMEVEPGEILSHSNAPCLHKGKGKAIDHRDRSPDFLHTERPHHSKSPPRYRPSCYRDSNVRRRVSPPHRPSTYRDYSSTQRHHAISPHCGRSRSPVFSTRHSHSRSPVGARVKYQRSMHYQSLSRRRSRRCEFSLKSMLIYE